MKNISGQYQDLLEGKMTQAQFLRNARMMFPSFVTQHNSFDDSVRILKQKGMLNEGNAVKGTPDKEPTYDYPTQPGKYKKVEQSPEVDEQDGIYPATTLTDIPKEEVSKPVKSKTRPDGLEDIKNNDTKNEMKKVKVVKEGIHDKDITSASHTNVKTPPKGTGDYDPKKRAASLARLKNFGSKTDEKELKEVRSFDDIFADFVETDDSTEIKAYLKDKGKEAITKIKSKITNLPDQIRTKLAKLIKVELDEIIDKEADKNMVIKLMAKYKTNPSNFEITHKQVKQEADRTGDIKYKHLAYLFDRAKAGALQSLANQDRFEADREGMDENKTSFDYKSTFEDLVIKTNTASRSDFDSLKQNWLERVENSKINPDTKKQMLVKINAINSLLDLQKFASYGLLRYEKMAVKENKESVLESLVTKIMNEELAKKNKKTVQEHYDEILDKIKKAAKNLNDDDAYELHEKLKTFLNKLI